jgi:hypothetical protein
MDKVVLVREALLDQREQAGRVLSVAGGKDSEKLVASLSSGDLLIAEDVDSDATDAARDELFLLACTGPVWMKELIKYLQMEREENEKMQEHRSRRLDDSLQGLAA